MTTPKSFLVQRTIHGGYIDFFGFLQETLPIVYFATSLVGTHFSSGAQFEFWLEADLQDSACMWLESGLYEIYVDLRYFLGVYEDMHHVL